MASLKAVVHIKTLETLQSAVTMPCLYVALCRQRSEAKTEKKVWRATPAVIVVIFLFLSIALFLSSL